MVDDAIVGHGQPTVLVFDSGVGGLSVCQSILMRCPECRILYTADNAAFPYGTKSETYLRKRILDVLSAQCEKYQPDIVVIACNTASTLVLPDLRAALSLPVVGVVPAIKPAATESRTGVIGLLATAATVRRSYTDQLVSEFAPHCEVVRVGSSRLVEIAEAYLIGQAVDHSELVEITSAFFCDSLERPVDKIVLGCTHFPLLREALECTAPNRVEWVDSGDAIAKRVQGLIQHLKVNITASDTPMHRIMFTGENIVNPHFETRLSLLGFDQFEVEGNIDLGEPAL